MTGRTARGTALWATCLVLGAALAGCETGLQLDIGSSDPEAPAAAQEIGAAGSSLSEDGGPVAAATGDAVQDSADYAVFLADLEAWEVYRHCAAVMAVRDHRRFDICFDILQSRVGDGTLSESGFAGREWNRAATVVRLEQLRAESLLDRGDLTGAEAAALTAAAAADDEPNYVIEAEAADWLLKLMSRADYGDPDEPFAHFRLRPLGVATAIAARRGERDLARAYLAEINAFDPARGAPGHAALWRRWKAIAHFVLGDYEESYQTLNRGPDMGIGGAAYRSMAEIGAVDPQAEQLLPVSQGLRPLDPRYVMELEHDFMRLRSALETGRFDIARQGLDTLLADDRLKGHPAIYARVVRDRGRIAAVEGAHEGAIASFQVAIDVFEGSRSSQITGAGKLGGWEDRQAVYADMIASQIAIQQPAAAFAYAERGRARGLVDRLAAIRRFAQAPPGFEETLAEEFLREERAALLIQRGPVSPDDLAGTSDAFRQAVQAVAPDLAGLVFVKTVPVAEIQAGLAPDEVLLAYSQHGARLYGFAVTSETLSARALDGEDLDELIAGFLRAIQNPRRRAYVSAARRLYNGLVRPFDAAASAQRMVVVPHGSLARLPFAALRDESGFLIEKNALRLLPSGQFLSATQGPAAVGRPRLLLLDPPEPGQPSPDLPGAPGETAAVERAWSGAVPAVGRSATETLLKDADGATTHLHLAGRCNQDPALLLAPDADNDGLLTLPELYQTILDVRLAVLSRCHAGRDGGDAFLGGLSEGFLLAGADAVTVSLWPVADDAAAALMERFYGGLQGGLGSAALRDAQLALVQASRHPYYWAGFQWLGAAAPAPPPGEG